MAQTPSLDLALDAPPPEPAPALPVELPLDQPRPDAIAPGEVHRFAVRLVAGWQYRIDIMGERDGGTLHGPARLELLFDPLPGVLPAVPATQVAGGQGSFYFTPQNSGLHELRLAAENAGSYAIAVRSTLPWAPVRAEGLPGTQVAGSARDDLILVTEAFGQDLLSRGPLPSTIDGGEGFDTVAVPDFWTLQRAAGGIELHAARPAPPQPGGPSAVDALGGTIVLRNIEAIEQRGQLLYILGAEQAAVARLYQAALLREPDPQGLAFYSLVLAQGLTLPEIAAGFMASPEFQARFGKMDDAAFVAQLYRNVLGREGEPEGRAFYEQHLAAGTMSREAVLVGFAASPENQLLTAHYILQV